MFDFKSKKSIACLIIMLISLAVMLITFYATDGLLGDKEFSEYSKEDWSIATLPLVIIIISGITTFALALSIIIPMIVMYPALADYVANKKFSDIDSETEFFAFDRNEFKRACCRTVEEGRVWFSVNEYDLKTKKWTVLEEGRYVESIDSLASLLQKEYGYDKVKFYHFLNK